MNNLVFKPSIVILEGGTTPLSEMNKYQYTGTLISKKMNYMVE